MAELIVGNTIDLKGCVTLKSYLKGRSLSEMERVLGFADGRLKNGGYICELMQLPLKGGYQVAGYSQVATHRTQANFSHVKLDMDIVHRNLMESWMQSGGRTLVKILPNIPHNPSLADDDQYPPGSGAPQWILTAPLPFKIMVFLQGNARY